MTTKTLGQVLYEADPWGDHRRGVDWDSLNAPARNEYIDMAQAVAAVVREQAVLEAAMQRNRAELLAEDIEALHLCLDRAKVPREDGAGGVYSMWGRVLRLMDVTREQCAQEAREHHRRKRASAAIRPLHVNEWDAYEAIRNKNP